VDEFHAIVESHRCWSLLVLFGGFAAKEKKTPNGRRREGKEAITRELDH
jgi:hypothetical protein